MPYSTYIVYSETCDKFYTGETENLTRRLAEHNEVFFEGAFTSKARDWKVFLRVEFDSRSKARRFEQFIKLMKSRKFILSLKNDPKKLEDLLEKFS